MDAAKVHKDKGREFFLKSKWQQASSEYYAARRAAKAAHADAEFYSTICNNIALCCMKLGRYVEAGKVALESATTLKQSKALFRLASALSSCGAIELSNRVIDHALTTITKPEDREEFLNINKGLESSSQKDGRRNGKTSPGHSELEQLKANVKAWLDQQEGGQAETREERHSAPAEGTNGASDKTPEIPAAEQYRQKGTEKYKKGEYLEALNFYTEALASEPAQDTKVAVLGNRAAAALMLKRWRVARADCEALLKIDENNMRAYVRACKACLGCNDIPQALHWAREAAGRDSANSGVSPDLRKVQQLQAWLDAAKAALAKSDGATALQLGQRAEHLYPDVQVPEVTLVIAEALLLVGQEARALTLSRNVLSESTSTRAMDVHARALLATGNPARALTIYEQMYKEDPDNVTVAKSLKRVRAMDSGKENGNKAFKEGRHQDAYNAYTRSLNACERLNNSFVAQVATNRANACLKLNRPKDAVDDATRAIQADSAFAKAYLRRAQAREQLEEWEGAVQDYNQALDIDKNLAGVQDMLKHAKRELKKSKRVDYYKLLDIDKGAGDNEIKKAYKRAALRCHPDKVPEGEREEAEKRFKLLQEANAILTDDDKRSRYDAGWSAEEIEKGFPDDAGPGMGGMGGMHGAGMEDILMQMFMGGGMGGMGGMRGGPRGFHM